jgi:hypothetical protein
MTNDEKLALYCYVGVAIIVAIAVVVVDYI